MKEAFDKRSFVFGVAVDDYNFTDRETETLQLRRFLTFCNQPRKIIGNFFGSCRYFSYFCGI